MNFPDLYGYNKILTLFPHVALRSDSAINHASDSPNFKTQDFTLYLD